MKANRIEGYKAIEMAERHGLTLSKFNDPIEDAREGLSPSEARDIAAEDPSLIYLDYEDGRRPCDACGELSVCRQATDPSGIVWTLCDDCNPELEGI